MQDLNVLKEKDEKLKEARHILKTEFFGIDSVIDGIVDSFRTWYLFPDAISKPIVVNLWGMTGCGKTSLVNRLCDLLELNGEMMYYNLAKLDEDSSDDMEENIKNSVSGQVKTPVFVLDEFQYAATIDSNGLEKDNKTALKTIWELIDTGKLYTKITKYTANQLSRLEFMVSIMINCGVRVENGNLVNLDNFIKEKKNISYTYSLGKMFNVKHEGITSDNDQSSWSEFIDGYVDNDPGIWLSGESLALLMDVYGPLYDSGITIDKLKEIVMGMKLSEFLVLLMMLEERSKKGYFRDYSNSIIFVIGNIDEAYEISYNMNPDMDADLFHEMTSKLTVVDIKKALQKRFRNEQIARLGSIMFLYPSFSVADFNDIITFYLNKACENSADKYGAELSYDQSLHDIIYKEFVFPTQGTRPIISGVYDIMESKISAFIIKAIDKVGCCPKTMKISFRDGKVAAECRFEDGGAEMFEIEHQMKIEDKRQNRKNETQAVTAVHESGHFVMYAKLFGKMPKKLVSNCVSSNVSGFMMPVSDEDEFLSKEDYLKNIQVTLGGYAAERCVFGFENTTSGAQADLVSATEIASQMVMKFGLDENITPASYTYLNDVVGTNNGMDLHCDNEAISNCIKHIIEGCLMNVEQTFSDEDWLGMLSESSKFLFDHTNMDEGTMTEIYSNVPERKRKANVRDEHLYRNKLDALINKS